jgi:hypothetical protein
MGMMRRRELLTGGLLAGAATMLASAHGKGLADEPATKRGQVTIQPIDPAAEKRRLEAARERAFAEFPFERVETTGRLALAKWRELKAAGRGSPVVLGDDLAAWGVMEAITPSAPHRLRRRPVADILAAAADLRHPESLAARHAELLARLMKDFAPLPGSKGDGTPPKAEPPLRRRTMTTCRAGRHWANGRAGSNPHRGFPLQGTSLRECRMRKCISL